MKLRVTPSVLEEWQAAEYPSWEDAGSPEEGHAWCILSNHKSIIEVRSTKEAALLIKSAYFIGDATGIDPSLFAKRRAIGGIGAKLIEAYGFYYRYPNFVSTKTGEVIPDPTIEPRRVVITVGEAEARFSAVELHEMARKAGLEPIGSKRTLCRLLINKGVLEYSDQ